MSKMRCLLCPEHAMISVSGQPLQTNHVNVGTIGFVDFGKTTLQQAIKQEIGQPRKNKSDRKRRRKTRWQ